MNKIAIGIFAATLLVGISQAQNTAPPPSAPAPQQNTAPAAPMGASSQPRIKIASGSVIPVQLTKTIDAKKAKIGSEVDAKVTQDMKAQDGQVVVAKDTEVIGHITQAQPRTKDQKESQLGIAFDRAVLKNGTDLPLAVQIQAIVAPQSASANENTAQPASPGAASPGSPNGGPGGMQPGNSPQTPNGNVPTGNWPTAAASNGGSALPPITGNTQGVMGYSNMQLASAPSGAKGSVISSQKNNVKLESGTFILLRVT